MRIIQLIANSILLVFISFVLISCGNVSTTTDQFKEINSQNPASADNSQEIRRTSQYPILEIWQELDGSVPIRGKSLYFRIYDDGMVEFDYELRTENESGKSPRYIYTLERTPPTKMSEEGFSKIKAALEELTKSKDTNHEYQPVALTLDVITKLTIVLKENESTKNKIVINDSDIDVVDEPSAKKFPKVLRDLIKEIRLMRGQLREQK